MWSVSGIKRKKERKKERKETQRPKKEIPKELFIEEKKLEQENKGKLLDKFREIQDK